MKILLLGSQHGNELLGEKLHTYILHHHPDLADKVTYLVGNPQARRRKVRFIESDLNRSYKGKRDTYEERRAERILYYIRRKQFNLVLDLHTTTCVQSPCLIVSDLRPELQRFIAASSYENIVHINHAIADTSLIGVCRQAVSVEVNKDEVSPPLLEALCGDLQRFIANQPHSVIKHVYEVTALLTKTELSENQAQLLENFVLSPHGFYPILVGENSYKKHTPYLGFKATKRTKMRYNKDNE